MEKSIRASIGTCKRPCVRLPSFDKQGCHKCSGAVVAVKMFDALKLNQADEKILRELRAEAEMMERLSNHPNIVKFVGAITKGTTCLYLLYMSYELNRAFRRGRSELRSCYRILSSGFSLRPVGTVITEDNARKHRFLTNHLHTGEKEKSAPISDNNTYGQRCCLWHSSSSQGKIASISRTSIDSTQ